MTDRCVIRAAVLALCALSAIGAGAQAQTRDVIVDTDAGPDDLMAIAYLLAQPAVRLEAVTIAFGLAHQRAGAANVQRLLDLAGRADVPIYLGRDTPRGAYTPFPGEWRDASDRMRALALPAPSRPPAARPAAAFLAERLRDPSRPVDVLALGALTNLAEALDGTGRLTAVRSLVVMGGALDVPGNLNDGWKSANTTAEWNLHADPESARRVLAAGLAVLLVPLDATSAVPIDAAFVRSVRQHAATPLGRVVADLLSSASDLLNTGRYFAWDPLAAVALVDRSVVRIERLPIHVQVERPEDGRTVRSAGGTNTEVALGADAPRFLDAFLGAFGVR
jgi:purine nucleosidase